jgi:hypothetical protein
VELGGRYSKFLPPPKLDNLTSGKRTERTPVNVHNVYRRLGPDIITQLITDYEASQPTTALMATYGLGKGTVLRLLREHGVELRHQPLTGDQIRKAVHLYGLGWSCVRVGEQLGRDQSLIWLTLKRAGVPPRDPQGRAR